MTTSMMAALVSAALDDATRTGIRHRSVTPRTTSRRSPLRRLLEWAR